MSAQNCCPSHFLDSSVICEREAQASRGPSNPTYTPLWICSNVASAFQSWHVRFFYAVFSPLLIQQWQSKNLHSKRCILFTCSTFLHVFSHWPNLKNIRTHVMNEPGVKLNECFLMAKTQIFNLFFHVLKRLREKKLQGWVFNDIKQVFTKQSLVL